MLSCRSPQTRSAADASHSASDSSLPASDSESEPDVDFSLYSPGTATQVYDDDDDDVGNVAELDGYAELL